MTIRTETICKEESYEVTLSPSSRYSITGLGAGIPLVHRLAEVMQLSTTEEQNLPGILYADQVPEWATGWAELNFRWCRFRFEPDGDGCVVLVPPVCDERTGYAVLWCSLYAIYLRVIARGGLPLHSALIEHNGCGYLLAAGGGVGKSTACRRLPEGWRALCDDEVLVTVGESGQLIAHPFPTWSNFLLNKGTERSWDIGQSVELKGIYFLQRADHDQAVVMGQGMATVAIYESAAAVILRSSDHLAQDELTRHRELLFRNAGKMAKAVPAYILDISLGGRFWEKIF